MHLDAVWIEKRLVPSIFKSISSPPTSFFFFFNDTATTEIYTLSLHDALPISSGALGDLSDLALVLAASGARAVVISGYLDRKSTRLNSSHSQISYAVFCLKKKKKQQQHIRVNSEHSIHQQITVAPLLHPYLRA